jgi:hypothetical protein
MKTFPSRSVRLWTLLLAAMALTLAGLGLGASPASAAGSQDLFKAYFSGAVAFGSGGFPVFSGTGQASYLGKISDQGYVVITGASATCPGGFSNDHYETLTAANGDSLTLLSHDVACPVAPGVYDGGGQWQVIGGTGRFSSVTGGGSLEGQSDFNRGVFYIRLTGSLSDPGGD